MVINIFGVRDIKLVQVFFTQLKKANKLTFHSGELDIQNSSFHLFMTENDFINNIYDENNKLHILKRKRYNAT